MATKIQITFDCADPYRLVQFWAGALRYKVEDPPAGFDSWLTYWRTVGVPEEELEEGSDSIVDPDGIGPRFRFQKVPEGKIVKNRLHLDLTVSGGRREPLAIRRERVNAEAERLVGIGATKVRALEQEGLDHYAMAMKDPEGNEFDLN